MSFINNILEGAILDRSHTDAVFFPTKQYIQSCFQVVLDGKTLRNRGTGGGHSGNASLTYKHGIKSTSSDASATDVRNIMIYPALSELLKGTGLTVNKIQTSYFLRFPNLKSYKNDDNGKLKTKYYSDNPYYTQKFGNQNFKKIFDKFIDTSIITDKSDTEALQCYLETSASAMKLADKFIGYINYSKVENENVSDWKRILGQKYIQGDDCESIELAVDWYVSNNAAAIEQYKKSPSLGDDTAYGVDDTNELIGASPAISLSSSTLLSKIPDSFKKSTSTDVSHTYTLPIRNDYSLLFLESFSIERTNDKSIANKGIGTHQRAYVFTVIQPDQNGDYTKFPGKLQLVYTVDNVENLNKLQAGYVYEVIMNLDEKKSLFKSNNSNNGSISSKLIGESGAGISAIEFPNEAIRRISANGIMPDFSDVAAMAPNDITNTVKTKEEKKPEKAISNALSNINKKKETDPKLESSFLWFPGWDWKD